MQPIDLKDLTPKGSKFKLSATKKEYRLRPVNLEDELWLKETFGDRVARIFSEQAWGDIFQIVFHQLEESDKTDFARQTITVMDGNGDSHTRELGGYKLLYRLVSGEPEKLGALQALLETIGISRDVQAVITEEELAAENKRLATLSPEQKAAEEKKSLRQPTTPSSSTGSQRRTAGRRNISSAGPLEK